ncbi:MAG TPA: TRAP transporter small permease subunit, partial [Vicinamibacterales bacterium]|nr:TRAP transporter small permease subunit [Vicinamibacterales bacterium]
MRRVIDSLARVLEIALALALIGAVLLNFVNVIGRYGFGTTMTIADELQTYTMVWIAFLGAAVVTWRGLHLRMDV